MVFDRESGEWVYWVRIDGALGRVLEPFLGSREEVEQMVLELFNPTQHRANRMAMAALPCIPRRARLRWWSPTLRAEVLRPDKQMVRGSLSPWASRP